jgi:hypothetical protein
MSSYEKMGDILKQVNLSDQRSELLKSFKKYRARSGIQSKFGIFILFLDPGSRPALRDLAGMTNCDTISEERGLRDAIHPRAKHGAFWQSS